MPLDLSSLTPITPQAGGSDPAAAMPSGLDLSSLRPMGSPDTGTASSDDDAAPANATIGSVAKQAGVGLVTGIPHAIAGITGGIEKGLHDTFTFSNPVTGENEFTSLGRSLGLVDGDAPKPDPYVAASGPAIMKAEGLDKIPEPKNAPERIARGVGEGASAGLIAGPGGALVGGISGGTGQGAAEAVPEKYKPIASLVGGIAGGVTGELAAAVPSVVKSGVKTVWDKAAPTEATQQRLAGTKLRDAAQDSDAAISSIETAPRELVPGSKPTTFQLTGDMGLGQLERSVAAENPAEFNAARAAQNSARLDALSNVQAAGHPEAVSDFFRSQLDDLDKTTSALHEAAESHARNAAAGIGGGDAATLGEQARGAIQDRLDAVRTQERGLWKAVDPDGNLQTVAAPVKQAVSNIYESMGPEAKLGLAPVENQIAEVVAGYGRTLPFQRLIDLRSAISQAMRDVRSPLSPNQPAYARLTQLRGAVEEAISDSVAQKAAQEQQAVATGALHPDDTMFSRYSAKVKQWYDDRALENTGEGNGRDAGRGQASFSGPSGSTGPAGARSGNNASGEDLSGPPLIDQATADRLKTATAATAERKQTFGAKPVSQILQRPGNSQPYTMQPAAVTSSIWKAGNTGADSVRSSLKAAGNSPEAIEAVKNMAAQSLRDRAENGVITPKALDAWKKQHGPALSELEKAAPGTMAKFENAATAGDHLATVAAERKAKLDAYQKSAAGKLLKVDNPADVVKTVGSIFGQKDAVSQMRALVKEASKDPAAMEGLRKAIVEHIQSKLISNTEAATSGRNLIKSDQFQTFMAQNDAALRQVFSDKEISAMKAIADDLNRANRSISAVKLPGGSNTAQDVAAMAKHGGFGGSIIGRIFQHTFAVVGGVAGGWIGGLAGLVGDTLWTAMRERGINNINELVKQAMLDPDLARTLMLKAPAKPGTGAFLTLARKMRNTSAFATANSQQKH